MGSVNIADLKNNLSAYLRRVRRGEQIVVRDRTVPIAKIVPLNGIEELDLETRELVASGQLRPAREPFDVHAFLSLRLPGRGLSMPRAIKAVSEDREARDAGLLGR